MNFRPGNLVQHKTTLVKVMPSSEKLIAADREGNVFDIEECARVFLSVNQFKTIAEFEVTEYGTFVIPGIPGSFTFNNHDHTFEWTVNGVLVRTVDYLDDVQNIYYYCTTKNLF